MEKLFFYLGLAFLAGLIFISPLKPAQAADPCSDPQAKWNIDYAIASHPPLTTLFSYGCANIGGETKDDPTRIDMPIGLDKCPGGTCPSGQKCFCQRSQDCEDIGGICFKNNLTWANKNIANGKKKADEFPGYTKNIQYRCPGDKGISCYVVEDVPYTPPPAEPPEVSVIVEKKQQPALPITPSSCCKQIVPDIGDPQLNEYSLNHLVQVAINVYECILCVIGALILLALVVGAFVLMTSAGNESRVGLGKQIITGAIIGGLIVFFSFLIVNFVVKALGAQFTNVQRVEINPQG